MSDLNNSTKTLAQMRSMVYFLISEKPTSSIFSTTNVDIGVNSGLNHIWKMFDKSSIVADSTTVKDIREYKIPEVATQGGIAVVDKVLLDGATISVAAPIISDGTTGTPTEYYIEGAYIGFNPTPDATYAYTVRFRSEHPLLVEDSDTSVLPDLGVDAAINYAAYVMKMKDEQYSAADRFKQEYEDLLKQLTSLQAGVYKAGDVSGKFLYGGAV